MDINTLVRLAQEFTNLGASIQEQARDILNGDIESANVNAIRAFEQWVQAVHNTARANCDDKLSDSCEALLEHIAEDRL